LTGVKKGILWSRRLFPADFALNVVLMGVYNTAVDLHDLLFELLVE
jgi:hypothetical protein